MTKFPAQKEVIDRCLQGILNAKESFSFWTNERLSLLYASDTILTMCVAQEISKIENAPEIFIDATIRDILRCSLESRDFYGDFMKKRDIKDGVFTITLDERFKHKNDNDSVSKVLISVRNSMVNSKPKHLSTIDTMCKMLYLNDEFNKSSLEYGVFTFYMEISSMARKKLDTRLKEIISNFDKIVSKYTNLSSLYNGLDIVKEKSGDEWCVGAYVIQRKG